MDTELALIIVDVQQDLGGFPDTVHGLEGVAAPEEGEIGHRVEFEKIRTGDHKEVADHEVRGPRQQEVGQTIEDIENIPSLLSDDVVDLGREGLETRLGVELVDGHPARGFQKRGVTGKAHIDHPFVVGQGGVDIGDHEGTVVFHVVHLHNHVVARLEAVQDCVQALDAGTDGVKVTMFITSIFSSLYHFHTKKGNHPQGVF